MNNATIVMVHTTCESVQQARKLAAALVEARLVACASVGAEIESVYPWEGRIEQEKEVPVTLKTTAGRLPELKARLPELHPYDVPELLAMPVADGHQPYLDWVREWVNG